MPAGYGYCGHLTRGQEEGARTAGKHGEQVSVCNGGRVDQALGGGEGQKGRKGPFRISFLADMYFNGCQASEATASMVSGLEIVSYFMFVVKWGVHALWQPVNFCEKDLLEVWRLK